MAECTDSERALLDILQSRCYLELATVRPDRLELAFNIDLDIDFIHDREPTSGFRIALSLLEVLGKRPHGPSEPR